MHKSGDYYTWAVCGFCSFQLRFFGFSRILVRFFGFVDSCDLRKWTYFWHGFRLYAIVIAVSRFLKKTRFSDIPLFNAACGLLIFSYILRFAVCASELQRTIIEPCTNEQCQWKIDIFLYVWYISFDTIIQWIKKMWTNVVVFTFR